MFDFIIELLESWANLLPLPLFTFTGALIEEVIAPVPSPLVMTLSGSLAEAKGMPVVYLALLAFTGAAGKTIGSFVIYWLADRFEDIITGRFGRFLGVSHKQIENLGARLEGKGEWWAMFLLRAIPIMPTAPVSFAAGVLALNLRTYLTSTFAGIFVRNLFYLYLGYAGTSTLERINESLDVFETIGYVILLAIMGGVFLYIYKKRRHDL